MSLSAILSGASLVGGLLGAGGGGGSSPNYTAANGYMNQQQGAAGNIGTATNPYLTQLPGAQANANNALTGYESYLNTDQGTNQHQAEAAAQSSQGAAAAYARAMANLSASLGARGMGTNSSIGAGALTDLAAQRAQGQAQQASQFAYQNYLNNQGNAAKLYDVTQGAANNDWAKALQGYGEQAGIYGNLGQLATSQANSGYTADVANQSAEGKLYGGLLSGLSNFPGIAPKATGK